MGRDTDVASAIVAVGDELLGGFTLDTNSHWLAQQLRRLGSPARRVTIVPDLLTEIVAQLRRDLADPCVGDVYCSGGLGPTPDDRTMDAVAALLGRELVLHDGVREKLQRRARMMHEAGLLETAEVSEGNLRMARIPAGPDHVFGNRRGMAPGLLYQVDGRRLFVLPGVPIELRGIFSQEVEPRFLTGRHIPAVVRELRFQFAMESRFSPVLHDLALSHPDVTVGSYPSFETRELVLRCTGQDERRVAESIEILRERGRLLGLTPVT